MSSTYPAHTVFYVLATVYLAVFFGTDRFSCRQDVPFLHSEWLCWLLMLAISKATERHRRFVQQNGHRSSDILALTIAAAAICWSLGSSRWAGVSILNAGQTVIPWTISNDATISLSSPRWL